MQKFYIPLGAASLQPPAGDYQECYDASDVDERIARLERVRLAASKYFENWLLDEAEDRLVCHSDEQYETAQALRDALNSCSLMERS
jgi:hypothetical protein